MTAPVLFAIAAGLAALAAFAGWRGARPPNLMKGPRLIPWRPIMVVAATAMILTLTMALQSAGIVR